MGQHIEETANNCPTCLRFRKTNTKEPMIPQPIPNGPWRKIAADVMTFKGQDYLLVADYFSKFVEEPQLPDKTAPSIIKALKSIFARNGIPEELISDNMPFASREFRLFAQEWGFRSVTSSPQYPQSNGLAERNIQTVKQLFRKADFDGRDREQALLDFRSAPITGTKWSPDRAAYGPITKNKASVPPAASTATTNLVGPDHAAARTTPTEAKTLLRPRGDGNGRSSTRQCRSCPTRKGVGAGNRHRGCQHAAVIHHQPTGSNNTEEPTSPPPLVGTTTLHGSAAGPDRGRCKQSAGRRGPPQATPGKMTPPQTEADTTTPQSPPYVTSRGRTIRRPSRYNDFW